MIGKNSQENPKDFKLKADEEEGLGLIRDTNAVE